MSAQFLLPARGPKSKTEGLVPLDCASPLLSVKEIGQYSTVFEIPILLGWLAPVVGVSF